MKNIDLNKLKEVCDNSETMKEASEKMELAYTTFVRIAKKYNYYKPNQGRKGIKREFCEYDSLRIPLEDILNGLYPWYNRTALKRRLIQAGIKKNECEICSTKEWLGKKLVCQLDHMDGNTTNHKLENLRMLCPNCHSQTETHSGKNTKKIRKYSKIEFLIAAKNSRNFTDLKKNLNLSVSAPNNHMRDLMLKYDIKFGK